MSGPWTNALASAVGGVPYSQNVCSCKDEEVEERFSRGC
jgi:hypothetical protein